MTILFFSITIFTIFYFILALVGLKSTKKIRDKYTPKDANLCVVVYATGDTYNLDNLITQLKSQTYPIGHFSMYVILDKCNEGVETTLKTDLNINVIPINNLEPIGKSQAYSIIAERLKDVENLDAYVFLNANNQIESDFLSNVNYYLTKYDVFMPITNYISCNYEMKFWDYVNSIYSRYISKFYLKTRSKLGLTNIINSDALIIKKSLLNKIAVFDFKDIMSEVNYTFGLAKENVKVGFIDDIKIYTDIKHYTRRIPSLSKRINLFWNNIMHSPNMHTKEFLFSMLQPNWLTCLVIYFMLISHTYKFPFIVSYSFVLITFLFFVLSFCISLLSAKIYSKEYLYLAAYPISSLGHMLVNLPPIRGIISFIKQCTRKHNIEKMLVNVIVHDGKNDYPCQVELISDDGLAKVKFINGKKTYMTKNNHLRMVDALRELTDKLCDYGLSLKICQCCKYFCPLVDGSTNMVKGCCKCSFEGRVDGDIIPTLIWNTCPKFESNNVVKLF